MFQWFKKQLGIVGRKGMSFLFGPGYSTPGRSTEGILLAVDKATWFGAAVRKQAGQISNVPWVLYRAKVPKTQLSTNVGRAFKGAKPSTRNKAFEQALLEGRFTPVETHPILGLLERPNPVHTKEMFFYLLACWYISVGGAYIHKVRDEEGNVVELWPVSPLWIKQIPNLQSQFYYVQFPGNKPEKVAPRDMMALLIPSAHQPHLHTVGVGHLLGLEVDIDEQAAEYIKSFFINGARPDVLIGIEDATEDDLKAIKEKYNSENVGTRSAHKTHFYSGKVDIHQMSSNFHDAQVMELRKQQRNTHLQITGTPPETIGVIDNANRSTIDAAYFILAKMVLAPILDAFWGMFQKELVTEFADGDSLLLDYSSPIPEDMETFVKLAKIFPGAVTINEARQKMALPKHPEGEEFYKGSGVKVDERDEAEQEADAEAKDEAEGWYYADPH